MSMHLYQESLSAIFPDLWIMVTISDKKQITIFACDSNLKLSEEIKNEMRSILYQYGDGATAFDIAHYSEAIDFRFFPIGAIPHKVKVIAARDGHKMNDVKAKIKECFPLLDADSAQMIGAGTLSVNAAQGVKLTNAETELLTTLLCEILPVGTLVNIAPYKIGDSEESEIDKLKAELQVRDNLIKALEEEGLIDEEKLSELKQKYTEKISGELLSETGGGNQ